MAKFSVGEVAVLALAYPSERWIDSSWVGREVTVISLPYVNDCLERLYYDVEAPWLPTPADPSKPWCVAEINLIKRRPPPDWEVLSNPLDVPAEELSNV